MALWRKVKEWKIKETSNYVWYGVVYFDEESQEFRVKIEVRRKQ